MLLEFDNIQNDIECSAEIPEDHIAEREDFENKYHAALAKCKSFYELYDHERFDTQTHLPHAPQASMHFAPLEGIKLTEIKLPKFDGSYETWLELRDIFWSLIHENCVIYTDFRKAFDQIDHHLHLQKASSQFSFSNRLVSVLKSYH